MSSKNKARNVNAAANKAPKPKGVNRKAPAPEPVEAEPVEAVEAPAVEAVEAPAPDLAARLSACSTRDEVFALMASEGLPDDAEVRAAVSARLDAIAASEAPVEAEPAVEPTPAVEPVEAEPVAVQPEAPAYTEADFRRDLDAATDRQGVWLAFQALPSEVRADHYPEAAARAATFPEAAPAPAPEPAPAIQPAPAPAPVVRSTFDATVVDATAAERIAAGRTAAASVGLAWGETWFQDGTLLADVGVDAARKAKAEIAALPLSTVALPALRSRVLNEARSDLIVPDVHQIKLDARGWIVIPGEAHALRPEVAAFQALAARADLTLTEPFMKARTLRDPRTVVEALAGAFNSWQDQLAREEAEAGLRAKSAVIGTRNVDGERRAYRVVSERYAREIGIDEVAGVVAEVFADLGIDPHAEVRYDGSRVQIDATFPTPVDPGAFGVGELWKIQVRVRSADNGTGGLAVSIGLHFARCLNFSQSTTTADVFSAAHKGDSALLARKLREAVATAHATVQPLIASWGAAKSDDLIATLPASSLPATLLAQGRKLDTLLSPVEAGTQAPIYLSDLLFDGFIRGVLSTREAVGVIPARDVPQVRKAWHLDDGPGSFAREGAVTRAGVVNSLTRYAHTEADPWAQAGIEALASSYLDGGKLIPWAPERARKGKGARA